MKRFWVSQETEICLEKKLQKRAKRKREHKKGMAERRERPYNRIIENEQRETQRSKRVLNRMMRESRNASKFFDCNFIETDIKTSKLKKGNGGKSNGRHHEGILC